ncbi:hypothetical protein [Methylobacterium indicum]|uniref:hypothetical protein n=1 Tax=Methylobacterium indicum TaxID=1775910 RepID=UPI002435601E|nr:hypothetical protein [Methylobacterium indicum]
MSLIADLSREIQGATVAVARAERAVASHPEYPSAVVTLRSAQKHLEVLEEKFFQIAQNVGRNVCSYRIEYDYERSPVISGVTEAIGLFQKIFTNVYHAVAHGPTQRAVVSRESHEATAFEFAYAFPGSVGFMMTLKNKTDIFGDSRIDTAMEMTMKLLSTHNHKDLDLISELVGLPAVRLTHRWAQENAKAGFGADIKWRIEEENAVYVRIQSALISEMSTLLATYTAKEKRIVYGKLLNVNMFDNTFQMEVDGKIINGRFDKAISETRKARVPENYIAHLTVATRIAPSEEDDGVTYFLNELEPKGDSPRLLPISN